MKIEKMKLTFLDYTVTKNDHAVVIEVPALKNKFQISHLQASYLDFLRVEINLESMFKYFLKQGWLINFRELYALLKFSVDNKFLTNPEFIENFQGSEEALIQGTADFKSSKTFDKSIEYSQLPFLRNLSPEVLEIFKKSSRILNIPAQQRFIKSGDTDRTLYIVLSGQVALYRVHGPQQRTLITKLSGQSILGEGSFLLNKARTADAITTQDTQVLAIPFTPELEVYLKSDKATALQQRFWILQALEGSEFFKRLPSDTIDQLVFSGRLLKTKEQQLLFQQGQASRSCYILVQGKVRIVQNQKTINVLNSGTCFGEISLLMSGGVRTATAYSELESLLLEIPIEAFYRVMAQNLFLAKEIEELAAHRLESDRKRTA